MTFDIMSKDKGGTSPGAPPSSFLRRVIDMVVRRGGRRAYKEREAYVKPVHYTCVFWMRGGGPPVVGVARTIKHGVGQTVISVDIHWTGDIEWIDLLCLDHRTQSRMAGRHSVLAGDTYNITVHREHRLQPVTFDEEATEIIHHV